jgi:hypothetical protein
MPDDALARLSNPGAEGVRRGDKEAKIVGKARRVAVDSANGMGKVYARVEIGLPSGPQLHGNSLRLPAPGAPPNIALP